MEAAAQFHPRLFNPLFWHLRPLLRDPAIRYIYIEGGSSAAKTFTISQALSLDMLEHNYSTIAFRRFQVDLADSVYSSFKAAQGTMNLKQFFLHQQLLMKSVINDARIRFKGLDDEENIKGIEDFNVVYNNEWSQLTEPQWSQQRKRLRGRPNQKFICDWNPISSKLWQYEDWLDKDSWSDLPLSVDGAPTKYAALDPEHAFKKINAAGDSVWMKVTYRDNYWVVGHPNGKDGYKDVHTLADFDRDRIHKPNYYRIYANGERGIMRTGGEFWKQFDEMKHVKPLRYAKERGAVHLTLDENVDPYVTVSAWQLDAKQVLQVHEIPCKSPDNNAPKAAAKTISWLRSVGHEDVVFVNGDPSSNKRSTIDENNSSFYDKFIGALTAAGYKIIKRVGKSAPQIALSAAFINDIYELELYGYSISISDACKVSIDDYSTVKEAPDGTMLKIEVENPATGKKYQPNGHYSDAKRYFITKLLEAEFLKYRTKPRTNVAVIRGAFG